MDSHQASRVTALAPPPPPSPSLAPTEVCWRTTYSACAARGSDDRVGSGDDGDGCRGIEGSDDGDGDAKVRELAGESRNVDGNDDMPP